VILHYWYYREPWSGTDTVRLGIRAHPWYGTILVFLEEIVPPIRHISRGSTDMSWVLPWMLLCCVINWWELRDSLADFSQRWQGIRQGIRTRTQQDFNFVLWMNISARTNFTRKLLRLFCVFNCKQILTKISFVIICAEMLQQFSPTSKRYQHHVCFLQNGEILPCESKIDKEIW